MQSVIMTGGMGERKCNGEPLESRYWPLRQRPKNGTTNPTIISRRPRPTMTVINFCSARKLCSD